MAEYNLALDKELFDCGIVAINDKVRLCVSIRTYNSAEPCIKVLKKISSVNGNEYITSGLGGLTANQATQLAGCLLTGSKFLVGEKVDKSVDGLVSTTSAQARANVVKRKKLDPVV